MVLHLSLLVMLGWEVSEIAGNVANVTMGVLPMLPKLSSSFQVRGKLIMAIAFF
jgi:hypothetical protein